MQSTRSSLAVAALVMAAAACGPPDGGDPRSADLRADAASVPSRGAEAPIVDLVIFVDYRSAASRTLTTTVGVLVDRYPGAVRLEVRHLPGGSSEQARAPHLAAIAAAAQGRFWDMHALLLGAAQGFGLRDILHIARVLGLDDARLLDDIEADDSARILQRDRVWADQVGIERAPALLLGSRVVTGVPSIEQIDELVQVEIKANQ